MFTDVGKEGREVEAQFLSPRLDASGRLVKAYLEHSSSCHVSLEQYMKRIGRSERD